MLSRVTPNKGQEDLVNMVIKNNNSKIKQIILYYGDGRWLCKN